MYTMFLKLFSFVLPWPIRRMWLNKVFGYKVAKGAKIGFAWVFPKYLEMAKGSRIDALTVAINLDQIVLAENAKIGRSNWITGFPTNTASKHFEHQTHRKSELIMCEGAAITKHHHIDCTNSIHIGKFTTLAGYYSQLLTHSINIYDNRQDSAPIQIGNYCFIGTNSVILGGSSLPNYSVLGAKSMLNKVFIDQWCVYGGNPAKHVKEINKSAKFFQRADSFVY